jgi:hypothetical protein
VRLVAGSRLRSQVCSTELIVVRGGEVQGELTCGGSALVPFGQDADPGGRPAPGLDTGTQVGKRYTDGGDIELLVTKAGTGTLALGQQPLEIKSARPLPSSD